MKTLKFKAIHKLTGKIVSRDFYDLFSVGDLTELKPDNDDIEVCQFTGFKDGSQKEIFDGDVLLDEYPRNEKDRLVVVVFESGCFQLHRFPKGQDETIGDWINDMNGPANEGRLLDYKVIGNQWMSQDKLSEEVFYASKSKG